MGLMHAPDQEHDAGVISKGTSGPAAPIEGNCAQRRAFMGAFEFFAGRLKTALLSTPLVDAVADTQAAELLATRLPLAGLPPRPAPPLQALPQNARLRFVPALRWARSRSQPLTVQIGTASLDIHNDYERIHVVAVGKRFLETVRTCRPVALDAARIVDEGEDGLLTVHHCLNNTRSCHAAGHDSDAESGGGNGADDGAAASAAAGTAASGAAAAASHGPDVRSAGGSESSDDSDGCEGEEDVLKLPHFVMPQEAAPLLEVFLTSEKARSVDEVVQELRAAGALDDDAEEAGREALLVCTNLGLLIHSSEGS